MKTLYIDTQENLTGAKAAKQMKAAGLKPIRFFDLYRDQYRTPEAFDVVPLPGVLFEFYVQRDVLTLNLHVMLEQMRSTANISTDQSASLELFDYVEQIKDLLIYQQTAETGKLKLIGEQYMQDDKPVTTYRIQYETAYTPDTRRRLEEEAADETRDIESIGKYQMI